MMHRFMVSLAVSVGCIAAFGCSSNAPAPPPAAPSSPPAAQPAPSASNVTPAPFAPSDYRVEWLSHQVPADMEAEREYRVSLTLKNTGKAIWPSKGTGGGPINQVSVSFHWLPAQGDKPVVFEGHRTALPKDIAPGETVTVNNALVTTPGKGTYRLQFTLVHEGVAWFEQQGASTLTLPVNVR